MFSPAVCSNIPSASIHLSQHVVFIFWMVFLLTAFKLTGAFLKLKLFAPTLIPIPLSF